MNDLIVRALVPEIRIVRVLLPLQPRIIRVIIGIQGPPGPPGGSIVFEILPDVAAATIPADISRIIVISYDATCAAAPMPYMRNSAQPVHLARVRSLDRFLPDGVTIDDVNGGWWLASPPEVGFDVRALGVHMDDDGNGIIGTDNTVALQNCIDTGFSLYVPEGFCRFDSKLIFRERQTWRGVARNERDTSAVIGGSVLVYSGKGARSGGAGDANEVAITTATGVHYDFNNFYDLAFWSTLDSTCTWIMRLNGAHNTFLHNVSFIARNSSILAGIQQNISNIALGVTTTITYVGVNNPHNGDRVRLTSLAGDLGARFNGREFYVRDRDTTAKTFRLSTAYDLSTEFDSTGQPAYTGGGKFQPCVLFFDTYGGRENAALDGTFVGGNIGQSCLQIVKPNRNDKFGQYHFINCHFETDIDRLATNPGQDDYLGYGWGFDIDYNDIHVIAGHRNNASMMGRHGGGMFFTGGNSENVSKGQLAGGIEEDVTTGPAGRALFILRNKAESSFGIGHTSIDGAFVGVEGSQGYYFAIIDASYVNALADVNTKFVGCTMRRNWKADIRLIGNTSGKTSGGTMVGCSTVDNSGVVALPRISVAETNRDGVPVFWRGFRLAGNVSPFPDEWLTERWQVCLWRPKFNSVVVSTDGCDMVTVGTPVPRPLASPLMNARTGGGPRFNITSSTAPGSSCECYADQFICWRGDAQLRGGFWTRFRFAPASIDINSRGFFGLSDTAAPLSPTLVPSSLFKCLAVGWNAGQANLQVFARSATTANTVDLGSNYPVVANAIYDLVLWAAPGGDKAWFRIERLDVKRDVLTFTYGGSVPSPTTLLAPHFYVGNDVAAGGVVAFDLMSFQARLANGDIFIGDV